MRLFKHSVAGSRHFRRLLSASLGLVWFGAVAPAQAADSLLSWKGDGKPMTIYHAYSASDGRTYIEQIPMPPEIEHSATTRAFLYMNIQPQVFRIAESSSGQMIDWHYAGDNRHLIIPMQGDIVFDIGDGKIYHVKAGEMILAEDWAGKGHRSGCQATDQKSCMVLDLSVGPNPKSLPMAPPPHP